MARTRRAETGQETDSVEQPQADSPAAEAPGSAAGQAGGKGNWVARFGTWADYEAGVRLTEDRENRRMMIKFDEKPSEAVREVMKREHGYQFDGEDQAWYKRVNFAKPKQSRQEAEDLALQVANMIRAEKELEQKQSFSVGM